MVRLKRKTDSLSRSSVGSLGRLNLARFFKHTLNALGGPCRGQGLHSDQDEEESEEQEDELSLFSSDDLLSHSDLEMFRNPGDDSGADVTTPLPDIDTALDLLEIKARIGLQESTDSDSENSSTEDSSSCDDWQWSSSCSSSSTTTAHLAQLTP